VVYGFGFRIETVGFQVVTWGYVVTRGVVSVMHKSGYRMLGKGGVLLETTVLGLVLLASMNG
jgi:hypothetical protein